MLDIGFSELLLIAVAALIVIGPKDLPVVIRHVMKFVRDMRSVIHGLKQQVSAVVEEAGLNDIAPRVTTIIDMDGNPQPAYDVRELEKLRQPSSEPTTPSPPPPHEH